MARAPSLTTLFTLAWVSGVGMAFINASQGEIITPPPAPEEVPLEHVAAFIAANQKKPEKVMDVLNAEGPKWKQAADEARRVTGKCADVTTEREGYKYFFSVCAKADGTYYAGPNITTAFPRRKPAAPQP